MHRGYIKIWRKIKDSGLYQLPNAFTLFMYMLTEAAYKPVRFGTVEVGRGELCTGRHKLSAELEMSEQTIRTAMAHLHDLGMITSKPTNKYTVYTIVNYGQYQDIDTLPNQQPNQVATNEQPANNQPTTTNKEVNKDISNTKPTSRKSAISISKFRENCAESGEKCIPTDDAVFDFAEKTQIPIEMVKVCWNVFVQRNTESGKRQADWRKAFRNCVQGNWYKLWFIEADGSVKETSQYRALKKGVEDV